MKYEKELLIDFQRYLRLPGVDNMRSDAVRATNYLSVHKAPIVRGNKDEEKDCQHKNVIAYEIKGVNQVTKCKDCGAAMC